MKRTDFLLALGAAPATIMASSSPHSRTLGGMADPQVPVRGIVNVREAGAHADGKSDDAGVIQSAFDTVAAQGGGEVHFPPGAYRIGTTIQLHDNVSLIGSLGCPTTSKGSPVTLLYSGTGAAFQCQRSVSHPAGFLGIKIRGVYLFDDGGKGTRGFDLDGFTWCSLEDCGIEGFDFGIYTKDDWYARYSNIVLAGARDTGAVFSSNSNNVRFSNIKLSKMAPGAHGAMRVERAKGSVLDNIGIETNTDGLFLNQCYGISVHGIYYENGSASETEYAVQLSNCSGIAFDGLFMNGNNLARRGIYLFGDNHAVTVAGAYSRQFKEKDVVGTVNEVGMMHGT